MPNLYIIAGANGGQDHDGNAIASGCSRLHRVRQRRCDCCRPVAVPSGVDGHPGRATDGRMHSFSGVIGSRLRVRDNAGFTRVRSMHRRVRAARLYATLLYYWLSSPDLALERVAFRVSTGGHSIPEQTIRRRNDAERRNLSRLYPPVVDSGTV